MKKLYLLFSHTLTDEQKKDASTSFGTKEFIYLPKELQDIWSHISPHEREINDFLNPIWDYLKKTINKNDLVLIQGDFGATHLAVKLIQELGATAIYATTQREIKEIIKDNKVIKTSIFKHVRFRSYE